MNFLYALPKCAFSIAIFLVILFGFSLSAHAADVTLTASPTSVSIGQSITVSYSVAPTSYRSSDSILMVNADTNYIVATQRVGDAQSGTKTFSTFKPGTYVFKYRASISKYPILATSESVTVNVPSASLYTLSVNKTSLQSGESLVITYAAPTGAHQSSDSIVLIDTATNRVVTSGSLGKISSGTKTLVVRNPGIYTVGYRLGITGRPIIKTVGPVTVSLPDASQYTLTTNATTLRMGEPLIVTYRSPATTYQSSDSIIVFDTVTNRVVSSQSIGKTNTGTKTFILRTPGNYTIGYRINITGRPVVKTAGPVIVQLPDASLYTLSTNITTAEIDQPITITYAAPAYAHQSGDDIILYDAETDRQVSSVTVGSSPSGTKTIRIPKAGTYYFGYRISTTGYPVIVKSAEISVVYVNLERIENYPLRNGPVIALGDSITFGRDATIGNDYVSLLSERLSVPIINAGVNGDTTTEALARLDADVLSKNPSLVIVFLGGNDFLQKVNTATIFSNLDTIVERITDDGSAVLILGYKNYFLINYDSQYRNLAWDNGAAYTPNVMEAILGNPFRTTDLVHPRDNGHDLIADRVEPYLRALLNR
ncbi:hypothetical protein IPH92_00470 [Candidatus Kaiserbacteria bacterium]|nr:MAG: hypothetical protein IPH92_00470 [Candidatus Kaiserbacteria bacterium]